MTRKRPSNKQPTNSNSNKGKKGKKEANPLTSLDILDDEEELAFIKRNDFVSMEPKTSLRSRGRLIMESSHSSPSKTENHPKDSYVVNNVHVVHDTSFTSTTTTTTYNDWSRPIRQVMSHDHMTTIRMVGDGNCFFRAISYALYNTQDNHQHIRHEIADYFSINKENYASFIIDMPLDVYLHSLCTNLWGGDQELSFAKQLYR
jgi:hypothetical protein